MGSLNKKTNYRKIAKEVIDLEIRALQKLKKALSKNFDKAVNAIVNCQSKVILCGVGKSGIIASKISATLSSIGTPSFSLSANDCSHGNMGSISRKDVLILISYSGNSIELKNIINYANRNKVVLIGITSKKNSDLYKNSDIGLITPEVKEAGLEMIPTSSTINQLSIGDALAISTLKKKKINNLDFKKFHPAGSLGEKLKTAQDLMLTKDKIPFIDEDKTMNIALKIMTKKKLGTLIVRNKKNYTTGIITDGQVRRFNLKNTNLNFLKVKDVMTKNPIKIDKDILATKALAIMNEKKITSLCVYENKKKFVTIGILHIHNILNRKIY
tara:strand:- start:1240 stop:2223 length:984 start_codon:yes stop_codon:yes gene_type:complete